MPAPRLRPARSRLRRRTLALVGALALTAACSTTVAGTAIPSSVPSLPSSAAPSTNVITEPSVLPGEGTDTPNSTPAGATGASGTATPGATTNSSATTTPPMPAAPAGLAKYYDQQLAWGPCAGYATSAGDRTLYASSAYQCARLTVPLAYSDPSGKTVTMAVLRKVATDPTARIGSLVIDPGGPGSSGMSFVAGEAAPADPSAPSPVTAVVAQLNARFDLVGIDPRGVGSSLPAVRCQTDAEKDAARAKDTRTRNAADVAAANALLTQQAAACVANTGKDQGIDGKTFLANVGTRDVARDLDVLRAALGDPRLSYLGFSYGTKIGYEYAEQFPRNVRAILFDGDENPNGNQYALLLSEYKGFQTAFESFAQWCAQNSADCPLGTDPSKAVGIYQSLVRPLLARPLQVSDGRRMSFGDAVTGTTFALYFNQFRPALARALTNLKNGDGDTMMALADTYDGRDSTGHYGNELEVLSAVDCVDGPRLTDPAQITALNGQLAAAAPYMATGDPAGAAADLCSVWPVPPTSLPHVLKITGLPTTLVVSTTGDPATPYADGVELAKEIGARLLTVKAVRHTSYLNSGDTCTDQIGTAYLLTLALPPAGTTCG